MDTEPTFTVERDGDRVALVPAFWPSDLDDGARRRYDDLRSMHVVDDGALTMPAEYLPDDRIEPGSTLSLATVWRARTDRLGALDVGPFSPGPIEDVDRDRDRIAQTLLETHGDCRD
ncbi:hypothetical protein G9C85_10145 [Halorubellus sp. JP-L1]|uniref:hypothetical protein n=1 Tax=Halorubellus sp. JP-L1 TaxID=2715753 RepID=UPI0014091A50|nr:hypothetical protein [Halorubellus sp. JP-L1]NHN41987.1 hypothetical protein [Halorubellus sp. JP-L1]